MGEGYGRLFTDDEQARQTDEHGGPWAVLASRTRAEP